MSTFLTLFFFKKNLTINIPTNTQCSQNITTRPEEEEATGHLGRFGNCYAKDVTWQGIAWEFESSIVNLVGWERWGEEDPKAS